ncbi:MAG: DUF6000 family protein [Myxococcota bacterium]
MSDEDERHLHSAGATVRHGSPFTHLDVPARHVNPDRDFITKWVQPFYLQNLTEESAPFVEAVRGVAPELTEELVAELLSYFNWRPRMVGAYFVAIKRFASFEDHIGKLLLRSDVCDAGRGYCAALTRLNSSASVEYLEEYLRYYMSRADLWFDQGFAMAAVGYLDEQNNTARREELEPQWQRFIENKPTWSLRGYDERFRATMNTLEAAASAAC